MPDIPLLTRSNQIDAIRNTQHLKEVADEQDTDTMVEKPSESTGMGDACAGGTPFSDQGQQKDEQYSSHRPNKLDGFGRQRPGDDHHAWDPEGPGEYTVTALAKQVAAVANQIVSIVEYLLRNKTNRSP